MRHTFPEATITLPPIGGGAFEVTADGTLVFSKNEIGRHAQPGEVLLLLHKLYKLHKQP